jgi:hypothetical protein
MARRRRLGAVAEELGPFGTREVAASDTAHPRLPRGGIDIPDNPAS